MRDKLNYSKCFVTILISLEILAGLMVLCITAYFHRIFIGYLPKTERQLLFSQITNIYILGFQLSICFSFGYALWHQSCKNDKITHNSKLLILWKSFSSLAVVCGSLAVWFQHKNIESLQKAYEASLFQGIDLYFTDPEWKILWDKIQIRNECCGVLGFEDWQEATWISEQDDCQQMADSIPSLAVIPYACCKRSATSCFESFAPHAKNGEDLYKDKNEINMRGCFAEFESVTLKFCYILCGIWVFCLVTEMVLLATLICIILKLKNFAFNAQFKQDGGDERPLVVLKYPRNVRCVTLTDEDTFGEEQDQEEALNQRFSNYITEGTSMRQDILSTYSGSQNIFVH